MRKFNIEVGDKVSAPCGCFGVITKVHKELYEVNWTSVEHPGSLRRRPSGWTLPGKRKGYQRGELRLVPSEGVGWHEAQGK
jgi:hypothetical protein